MTTTTLPARRPAISFQGIRDALLGADREASLDRAALLGLALLAGALYVWALDVSGYANTYYSAAAQAASQSWSAWFFGSLDASNFITVDKPPAALWLMGLSVRVFGLSSWSVLLPEALAGVATVLVVHRIVRAQFDALAAAVAGIVTALTPAAVLIFRYNNPDALLTLLLVLAAWAVIRLTATGHTRWVVVSAALVGLAFLTKYLQAYVVLPSLGLVLLVAAPGSWRRRVIQLLIAAGVVLITSGWWVTIMELIPAGMRPHIGGSTNDSVLDLIFGYDGLGRLFGASAPGGGAGRGGGGIGAGFGGATGILRLFNEQWGGQIAWLIPAALAAACIGLWITRRAPRTDHRRAGYLLWSSWLVVHLLLFSLASGIIHPYYAVILAPGIGALVGAGASEWWARRHEPRAAAALLLALAGSAGLAVILLGRTPAVVPWLAGAVIGVSAVGALAVIASSLAPRRSLGTVTLALVLGSLLLAPGAYAVQTVATAHSGGDPKAGPAVAGGFGGPGGGVGLPDGGRPGGGLPDDGFPGGGPPGGGTDAAPGGGSTGDGNPFSVDQQLIDYLLAHRGSADWIVAADGSGAAASIQLAAGAPVMAMGGFTGGDPWPDAAELASLVHAGRLRYVLVGQGAGGAPGGGFGAGSSSGLTIWVTTNCKAVTVGGTTGLYDCAP